MKTYDYDGRKFTVKKPSLALENLWLQFAITEDGALNKNCVKDISRDPEAVNMFMRKILEGDHEGIDWYEDAPAEMFGEVFADFFTNWSARIEKALDTASAGLTPERSSTSPKVKGKSARKGTQ